MARVVVYHAGYGCETGCCGHVVEINERQAFKFSHPASDEDRKAFAEGLVRQELGDEHVADLVWDECFISDD